MTSQPGERPMGQSNRAMHAADSDRECPRAEQRTFDLRPGGQELADPSTGHAEKLSEFAVCASLRDELVQCLAAHTAEFPHYLLVVGH